MERERAIKHAEECLREPVEVIVFFQGHSVKEDLLFSLGESIKLLSVADVAYFVYNRDNARGYVVENICAQKYGIKTIIEDYTEDCKNEI
nr:MAG TPA: hypothetical protein [Caudoviricetes sp.]